jgi:putative oxidoreductase
MIVKTHAESNCKVIRTHPHDMRRFQEITFFLLRVVAGFEFLQHGLQKTLGLFGGFGPQGGKAAGLPLAAGYIETIAGSLIIVGLLTRPAAFISSGEMATAYFKAHVARSFWPILNRGELPVLFCFVFLYIAAVGAGKWSLDELLFRDRQLK